MGTEIAKCSHLAGVSQSGAQDGFGGHMWQRCNGTGMLCNVVARPNGSVSMGASEEGTRQDKGANLGKVPGWEWLGMAGNGIKKHLGQHCQYAKKWGNAVVENRERKIINSPYHSPNSTNQAGRKERERERENEN